MDGQCIELRGWMPQSDAMPASASRAPTMEVIMFRHIAHTVTSLTLAAIGSVLTLTGVSSARAQAYPTYVAAIPFAFGMDNAVFPAGTYQFTSLSQHMLRLDLVGGRRMA